MIKRESDVFNYRIIARSFTYHDEFNVNAPRIAKYLWRIYKSLPDDNKYNPNELFTGYTYEIDVLKKIFMTLLQSAAEGHSETVKDMINTETETILSFFKDESFHVIQILINLLSSDSERTNKAIEKYFIKENIFESNFSLVFPFSDQFLEQQVISKEFDKNIQIFLTKTSVNAIPNEILLKLIRRIVVFIDIDSQNLILLLGGIRFDSLDVNFEAFSLMNPEIISLIYFVASIAENSEIQFLLLSAYKEIIYEQVLLSLYNLPIKTITGLFAFLNKDEIGSIVKKFNENRFVSNLVEHFEIREIIQINDNEFVFSFVFDDGDVYGFNYNGSCSDIIEEQYKVKHVSSMEKLIPYAKIIEFLRTIKISYHNFLLAIQSETVLFYMESNNLQFEFVDEYTALINIFQYK